MATNKERIELLETGLGGVQDGMQRLEDSMINRLHHLEETINKLSEAMIASKASSSYHNNDRDSFSRTHREDTDGGRKKTDIEGGRHVFSSKMAKLEFPRYSGNDPTEWFNRVDQFFEYQETTDTQKVSLASFHLEGEANQWWQWLHRAYKEEGRTVTWEIFEEELWARFGPTECEDFDEALSRVRQVGSLRDYQKEFERLGNRVHGWTQKALVGTFMGGLKVEISDAIRMFKPRTLKEAISLARMKDEQLTRQGKFTRPIQSTRTPLTLSTPKSSFSAPIKRLSWDEMQRRRAQGLCFNCNDKFTAGHKCQRPQLLLLESLTEPDRVMCEEDTDDRPVEDVDEENTEPEISLHALTGWSTPRTMRIEGRVGNHTLTVLIDSGSTHNFINSKIAEELQLPVIPMGPFTVRVADGNRMKCQGRFEQIQVILQNIPFSLTLYSIPITGLDLVLGVQWLEQLGPVVCNWKQMTMDFWWKNQAQTLNGSGSQIIQSASLTTITKDVRHGCSTFTVYCQSIDKMEQPNMQTEMQEIINKFEDIFYEPTQLPPTREIDHCILLKEGTEPVNVRPYRYAYFQKTEIEKQVQDMLKLGLIKPSTSPFSSPVLLVKKKMALGVFVLIIELSIA
jgi:hypothetical protein